MKKIINPFTGKEDYVMNYRETAEHLDMKLSDLHFRYDKRCKLHNDFIPKRRVDYGKYIFYLSEVEHFKNNNKFAIPKPKVDVKKDTKETKEANQSKILKFTKS